MGRIWRGKKTRARGQKQRHEKDQAVENNRAALLLTVMCTTDQKPTLLHLRWEDVVSGKLQVGLLSDGESIIT